jgi:hypothetical protein
VAAIWPTLFPCQWQYVLAATYKDLPINPDSNLDNSIPMLISAQYVLAASIKICQSILAVILQFYSISLQVIIDSWQQLPILPASSLAKPYLPCLSLIDVGRN